MKDKSIIVFDSGFGGISVLKRLVASMPNENYLYYGDSANAPYGSRPKNQVQELTLNAIAKAKAECEPKAIVIACNTATAAARELVQSAYPDIPVIGILPAVEIASTSQDHPNVLVLATASTVSSDAYLNILSKIEGTADVVSVAAPEIVRYVERGMCDRQSLIDNLTELLAPYKNMKFHCVVLGCTHFPFAADVIEEVLGYPVQFFDGGVLTTKQTEDALENQDTRNTQTHSGSIRIINSGNRQDCIGFAWKLFSTNLNQ